LETGIKHPKFNKMCSKVMSGRSHPDLSGMAFLFSFYLEMALFPLSGVLRGI
jgi:hypothetical protein